MPFSRLFLISAGPVLLKVLFKCSEGLEDFQHKIVLSVVGLIFKLEICSVKTFAGEIPASRIPLPGSLPPSVYSCSLMAISFPGYILQFPPPFFISYCSYFIVCDTTLISLCHGLGRRPVVQHSCSQGSEQMSS